jgi:hypothetical protein
MRKESHKKTERRTTHGKFDSKIFGSSTSWRRCDIELYLPKGVD